MPEDRLLSNRSRPTDRPDAHCVECPFSDRGDWVMYRDEYERLVNDRIRAIETRENANSVSVRVEAENRTLQEQHERDLIQVREAHEARRIAEREVERLRLVVDVHRRAMRQRDREWVDGYLAKIGIALDEEDAT